MFWGGEIPWLTPSDITDLPVHSTILDDVPTKITQLGYASCATKILPKGTVCVTSRATVGACAILGREMCTNQGFVNVVCSDHLDPLFFLYWVRQHKDVFVRLASGTTFDEIGKRAFRNIEFLRPVDLREQNGIARAIEFVDLYIAATSTVIEASESLKRGLTRELLSGRIHPDGTPRAMAEFWVHDRLGNIPQGWRVARVGELFRLKNGKSNVTSNLRSEPDRAFRYPVYGGNGMTGWSDRYFLREPTIVIGRVGEYCGAVHATPSNSWITDNALYVEDFRAPLDVPFLFSLLKSLRLNRWKATTGQPKITQGEILNIRVAFPESLAEQRQIAECLYDLENLMEAKQAKITALQRLKKSLMQNLLTGRMRLSPEAIAELTADLGTEKSGGA